LSTPPFARLASFLTAAVDTDAIGCRRRCSRYRINGDKAGTVERFIDSLPGYPDNIRYDGEGRYWIALSAVSTHQPKNLLHLAE
jgi:sugar lactone lactonase YvrE